MQSIKSLAAAFPNVLTYGLCHSHRDGRQKDCTAPIAFTFDCQIGISKSAIMAGCSFISIKGCPFTRGTSESTANSMPIFEPVYNVAIQTTYCTMQLYTTCPGKENSCARISKRFRSAGIDHEGSILLASVAGVDHNLTLCPLHGQPHARVEHNPIRESTISLSQGLWI